MADEIFDVVNERDEVIGREIRREVHRRNLLHRAVHVMVFNQSGALLLQKRSMLKDNFPGVWDSSSSGHLDAGELYDACASRELREEIGLVPERPAARLFKIDGCPETGYEFVWLYACRSEGPFALQVEEVDRVDWFSLAEIDEWVRRTPGDFAGGFLKIWTMTRQRGGWPRVLAEAASQAEGR
jgi:isopentenyl-diphosphate delta-isomerase type 1